MKSIETVRNRLNKAIESGCSKDTILTISKELDDLIVAKMKAQKGKYIKRQVCL